MRKSLYARLAVVLLMLFCAVGAVYVAVTLYATGLYLDEVNQRVNRGLAATILNEKPVMKDGRIDWHTLDQVFDALMAVNPTIEIYLLDPGGRILAFSAPPGKVKRRAVALDPIRRFLRGERLPIRGDDPRDPARRKIFSTVAMPEGGYLYVILGGEHYDSVMEQLRGSWILQQTIGIAIAGVIFAFIAGLLLFAAMTRPLRSLMAAMDEFRQSDFSGQPRVSVARRPAGDEVDRLASTFEEMAGRMILQVQKLKEVDLLRRELVANVSHDLRTPLASLQGYLDTLLLKEGVLTRDEQRRFLEIASKHSMRLGRLVAELFELAKLDAQVTPLRLEPFSIAELVQDVVQKYQLRAQQGGIALTADTDPERLPLVSGDIALIERVLENLIDNALRHTPSGGAVTIVLTPEGERVRVQVSDTGVGISEEHLPHIFDRFYRGEQPARGDGAGLGLAIAKRILELHGTVLQAESRVDEGTTFVFSVAA
jgi:two-component system OmpR family sensor kinase